jgi:uncharacterized protein (TIGR02246 family)
MTRAARHTARALLFAIALAAPRVATAQAARVDTAAVIASGRPEIEEAHAAWLPGLRSRDADAIVAAYADSGIFVTADGHTIRGRAAIAEMYRARFPKLPTIRDGAVVQGGIALLRPDVLVEWGGAWLELAPSTAGAPTRSGGNYVTLWQRQSDGRWRIVRNVAM